MKGIKNNKSFKFLITFIMFLLAIVISINFNSYATEDENMYVYLSDIPYEKSKSSVGYSTIILNKTCDNTDLSLKLENTAVTFKKGVFAHATSTVIYDLTNYSEYDYFTTYYGISSQKGNNGSVKFYIYTSKDGTNWDLQTEENPDIMTGNSEAKFVKIDIRKANYLKLYADSNGANGQDHSLYADAKLIKEGYSDNILPTVEEYDVLIKQKYNDNNGMINDEIEKLTFQRDLVKNIGKYQLKNFFEDAEEQGKLEEYKEAFYWLFDNLDILRLYIAGGKPDGSYLQSLKVLVELYTNYKEDLSAEGTTESGIKLSDIYTKMIITLSLTHSRSVTFWIQSSAKEEYEVNPNVSIPTKRYAIYKDMLINNKLNPYFEQLEVEEMRMIMNSMVCDDEIEWLRDYIVNSGKNWRSSYQFMGYVNVNMSQYLNDRFYGDNRAQWNDKYKLSGYDIANIKYFPKTFMIMEVGGVCWQISNVGQTMTASYGVPSVAVGQPGHVAYFVYDLDKNKNAVWTIWNNVGGWQTANLNNFTKNRGSYKVRLLNGWGSQSFASNNCGSYIMLGQAAISDYDNYVKAEARVRLANSFENMGDKATADKLYREALEIQKFNLDALESLIKLHINEKKGLFGNYNEDLYELANLTAENIKYYPLPMYDLLKLIGNSMDEASYKSIVTLLQKRTLTEASKATEANVLQSDVCRTMANYILGNLNFDIASFAFDTEDGAKITLSKMFDSSRPYWDYSLDGGTTWIDVTDGNFVVLTNNQIQSITSENDILVHLIGVNYTEQNIFRIDIKESEGLPKNLYANDLENKLIDSVLSMEWKLNESDNWVSFKKESPNLSGDKKIIVRMGATGVALPSDSKEFIFTEDSKDLTKSYISIDHLSVDSFSSETVRTGNQEQATNAINGNINTFWHTSRTSTTDERYIVIKFDKPRYISQIEYVPVQNYDYGVLKNGIIWSSLDGENWVETYKIEDLPKSNEAKTFTFEEPDYTQYIKLKCTQSYDYLKNSKADWFLSVAMLNFFEDSTIDIPVAGIEYSRYKTTAMPVVAKLINPSTEIKITNNDGNDTYTFTENGTFVFKFEDRNGNKGSAKAVVDWIVDYSFSFDGEDPNTIILSSKYKDKIWEYSIDGGTTWKKSNELTYTLTEEEIDNLDSEKDLKIRIQNDAEFEEHTIDILPAETLSEKLYGNDWENAIIGATNKMEWNVLGEDTWTSYEKAIPDLSGDKIVQVRMSGTGTVLRGNEIKTFTFTQDVADDKRKYIPIDDLTVVDCSSESPDRGEPIENAIDGNINTMWHTNHTTTDDTKYITIKLNKPQYISALEWIPKQNYNYGIIKDAVVSVSLDGEEWKEVASITNSPYDYSLKSFECNEKVLAQYVKLQCLRNYDDKASGKSGANYFLNAAIINIYHDTTLEEREVEVTVDYDITTKTNKNVTARVYAENGSITITNNEGKDTYVFKENGSFTFEYIDSNGKNGSITATVSWIDKNEVYVTSENYLVDLEEKVISNITDYTSVKDFKNNINTNKTIIVKSKDGKIVEDEEFISTGMKVFVGDEIEFVVAVIGDVDGDGKLTINDIAKLKLHCIEKEVLKDIYLKAGDLDSDKKVSINDLAKSKIILINK